MTHRIYIQKDDRLVGEPERPVLDPGPFFLLLQMGEGVMEMF